MSKRGIPTFGCAVRRFDTPIGRMTVVASRLGLHEVCLPPEEYLPVCFGECTDARAAEIATQAEREILEYLAGRRREFTVPVDLGPMPSFREKVMRELARVPYGETVTYADLAARAGSPGAARAVGNAMAGNPFPLVLPCHRVLASGGRLGDYGGGVDLKRRLLELEGRPSGEGRK